MIKSWTWFLPCAVSISFSTIVAASPNPLLSGSNIELADTSPISNATWALAAPNFPIPLPYFFSVPNSQIILNIGFGWRRRPLDPMDMRGLIAVAQHEISEVLEEIGPGHLYPISVATGQQWYDCDLGYGIELWVQNLKGGRYFLWDDLSDVVEGLRSYLIVGERFRRTYFQFWRGAVHLGSGSIGRKEPAQSDFDDS